MSRPNELPSWCDDDAASKVVEPSAAKKLAGFLYLERPAMQYFNWIIRNFVKWIIHLDDLSVNPNWSPAFKIGNSLAVTGVVSLALCYLSEKEVVVASGNPFNEMRTYRWNGKDWTQVGNSFTFPVLTNKFSAIRMTDATIAFTNQQSDDLSVYSWDGADWVKIGNSLAISTDSASEFALCQLDSSTIVLVTNSQSGTDNLRVYSWDGADFTQVGNAFTLTAINSASVVGLDSQTIAYVDGNNDSLITYSWNGTDFTQVGNALDVSPLSLPSMTSLNSSSVVVYNSISGDTEGISIYYWDGLNWTRKTTSTKAANNDAQIAGINGTDIVIIDSVLENLDVYRFSSYPTGTPYRP